MTRREEMLKAIRSFVASNGYPPTVRELAAILGIGHSTAQRTLLELIGDGSVERTAGAARGLRVKP